MKTSENSVAKIRQGKARRQLERAIDELPVLPTVVARLMVLDKDADDFFEQLLELIQSEPNFSTRILAAANSSSSAGRVSVGTIRGALTRIGSNNASSRLIAMAVTKVFVPRDEWERSLWRHAFQVASLARAVARQSQDPELLADEAYIAGLLHDVGRFLMFLSAPEKLQKIDEGDWDSPEKLVAMEREICGLTHAELGALACQKWLLPDYLVEVVRTHHTPETGSSKANKLTVLVHFADIAMFPSATPGSPGRHEQSVEEIDRILSPLVPESISCSPEQLRELIQRAAEDAEQTCSMLGIA